MLGQKKMPLKIGHFQFYIFMFNLFELKKKFIPKFVRVKI